MCGGMLFVDVDVSRAPRLQRQTGEGAKGDTLRAVGGASRYVLTYVSCDQ